MKLWSKIASLVLALAMVLSMSAAFAEELKPVELNLTMISDIPVGWDEALAEFNKLAKEELNCTLTVNFLSWSNYDTVYPMMVSSGEVIDLIYCAGWMGYSDYARKGAFMPLTMEMIEQYMPATFAALPEKAWEDTAVDGAQYAIPSNAASPQTHGVNVRGDIMKAAGIEKITNLDDFIAYLTYVAENCPEITYPIVYPDDLFEDYLNTKGYDKCTSDKELYYKQDDPYNTIQWIWELEEFEEAVQWMVDLANKGLWSKSVLSMTDDAQTLFSQGATATYPHNIDSWVSLYQQSNKDWDVQWYTWGKTEPISYQQDMTCIGATCENPERAMMLLDKIRSDNRYYDLLVYGIPGKDHQLDENGYVEMISEFNAESGTWGLATTDVKRLYNGAPANYSEVLASLNANTWTPPFEGLNIDWTTNISSERAMLDNVETQYLSPLMHGISSDVAADVAKLRDQAAKAFADVIKEEVNTQIQAWLETK